MKSFAVSGRCIATPTPPEWHDTLAQMLGAKPRRIGTWAELGLYGALRCMADAGEAQLPRDAQIWMGSRRGTYAATDSVIEQMRADLPMPLAFLQTQPSQLLALLSAHMRWQGHACFLSGASGPDLLRLAAAQAGAGGILLGIVDEMEGGSSNWLRLQRSETAPNGFVPASAEQIFAPGITHLRIAATGLHVRHGHQDSLGGQGGGW